MIRWKTTRWQFLGVGMTLLFTSVLFGGIFTSFTSGHAYAATSACTWTNGTTITCNGETFTQSSTSGASMTLVDTATNGGQCAEFNLVVANYKTATSATYTSYTAQTIGKFGTSCKANTSTVSLSNTNNAIAASVNGGTGAAAPNEYPTCYTNNDPMSYILCPIFNSLSSISNWIFQNILTPFLVTAPIGTSSSDTSFKIWSSFRVYGDIVLVVALLVAVIGQVIGGGVVDAYTFRKVIPRVLVAAILINLSVYIVALMVDITNIIGKSIGNVMTAPLAQNNAWNFTPNAGQSVGVFGAGLLGLLLAGGGVAVITDLFFSSKGGSGKTDFIKIALYAAMFVILPMVLALIAVFVTLIIRKGLILFLVIISPVAFALYCLPNTEKYFKKWWDLLLEALLVYPIIVVIFAVADILAVTILSANGITKSQLTPDATGQISLALDSIIATMVAFFLQFLPLLAIPFSFRMAGGTLSRLHEAVTTGSGKINEMAQKRGAMAKRDFQVQKMQAQNRVYTRLNNSGHRFLANRAGGYDIHGSMSAMNAETKKEFDQTTNNGDDTQLRAFSVNKADALAAGPLVDDGQGNMSNGRFRTDKDGKRQFKTLGGRWVGEGDVDAAQQRWKGNHFMQQQVLAYEMKKATTQEQNDDLVSNYGSTVRGWGMNDNEAGSAWTGAAYANQGNKLEMKYYKYNNGALKMDGQGLTQEIDETRGSYDVSKFTADTWASLHAETANARQVAAAPNAGLTIDTAKGETNQAFSTRVSARQAAARETIQRGSRIARSLVQSRGQSSTELVGDGDNQVPVTNQTPGGYGGPVVSLHGAAPAAQEAAERFVQSYYPEAQAPVPNSYQEQARLDDRDRTNVSSK